MTTVATGEKPKNPPERKPQPGDFYFGTTVGEGAYARVVHGRMKNSQSDYAVKIMEKRFIKKENKVKFVMMERKVFSKVSHPRIVKLYFTFQDHNYLYMVMELCRGGELLDVINKKCDEQKRLGNIDQACSLELTRFYVAELIQALEYLHQNQIIHRDLKPENILLTDDGHLKLTDFGTAKDETSEESRHNTFCGTAEYVSPEVLRDQEASRGCDLWAIGCIIFQMLVGRPMFRAENEYLTFQKILNHPEDGSYEYPASFPKVAADLISRLLLQDPKKRLGAGSDVEQSGYEALKSHPFFEGVDWTDLHTTSPYRPTVNHLPPPDNDGSTDDWLFAGVATELKLSSGLADPGTHEPLHIQNENGVPMPISPTEIARQRAAKAQEVRSDSLWNRFLDDEERISMASLVSKRKGLFSKKRQLILTSKPRLIYIDPIRMKQKGEMPWSKQLYIQVKNSSVFDVVTPNRTYHMTDHVNGSNKWKAAINAALLKTP